jgi:hypothetical protein
MGYFYCSKPQQDHRSGLQSLCPGVIPVVGMQLVTRHRYGVSGNHSIALPFRVNVLDEGLSLAGFQVIMYDRFWVITEVSAHRLQRCRVAMIIQCHAVESSNRKLATGILWSQQGHRSPLN